MSQTKEIVSTEIIERLLSLDHLCREDVNRIKIEVCRLHRSPTVPPNSDLLQRVPGSELVRLKPILTRKQVRSASGVTTVAPTALAGPKWESLEPTRDRSRR